MKITVAVTATVSLIKTTIRSLIMKVARTITLDLEDLIKIDNKVKNGEFESVSQFIQNLVKTGLKIKEGEDV